MNFRYIWISVNLLWKHTTESSVHSQPILLPVSLFQVESHHLNSSFEVGTFPQPHPKKQVDETSFCCPIWFLKMPKPKCIQHNFCSLVCFPKNSTNRVYKTIFCCSIWFPKMSKTKSIAQECLLSFWLLKMANTNILDTSQINKKTKQAR